MSTDQYQAAFPGMPIDHGHYTEHPSGLTAREHAAIALRVPDSGNDWLDAMIRTAQRNELAKAAMAAIIAMPDEGGSAYVETAVTENAYSLADAMLSGAATPTGDA